jgi:predicted SnoaL-like aldol condensation-catalyzing enzyme
MSEIETNKGIARRFVKEVLEGGQKASVDELVAPGFTSHSWPSTGDGRADLKAAIDRLSGALADVRFDIEDTIAEGDRVCLRLTASATQVGRFMDLPPTGRHYSIGEVHIFRLRNGQLVEHWDVIDSMAMMQQLGAMGAAA